MTVTAPTLSLLVIATALFATGAALGSFLALVADRWPRGEDFVHGRSRCRACAVPLRARDLVPVWSWLRRRWRCAGCGAAIPPEALVAELAGGAIALVLPAATMALGGGLAGGLALAGFAAALLLLALIDARHLWLPDRVTLPLILAGLASAAVLPRPGLTERGWGAALGWLALWAIGAAYRRMRGREGLGAGDAKLLAGIGAWLGAAVLPDIVLAAAALGLGWALLRRAAGRGLAADTALPLGTLLAIATLLGLALAAAAPSG